MSIDLRDIHKALFYLPIVGTQLMMMIYHPLMEAMVRIQHLDNL